MGTRRSIGEMFRLLFTSLYIVIWWGWAKIGNWFVVASSIVLVGSLLIVVVEVIAHVALDMVLRPEYPIGVKISFVVAIVIVLLHKIFHWISKKQEFYFIDAVDLLTHRLNDLSFVGCAPAEKDQRLKEFLAFNLAVFRNVFKVKSGINANIATEDPDGALSIKVIDPPDMEYPPFAPKSGEGGAGLAYQEEGVVYIPWVRCRHGVVILFLEEINKPTKVKPEIELDLYVKTSPEKFRSILSAAILSREGQKFGVLNLDSRRRAAFSEVDFKIARTFANLLGLAYDRHAKA